MYARGFSFVKIDLNKVSATQFTIVDDRHLMPSLISIDGMGEAAANNIVDAVQNGSVPFTSIRDFRNRAHVSQTITEKLKELKILENLPEDDQLSLFDAFGAF